MLHHDVNILASLTCLMDHIMSLNGAFLTFFEQNTHTHEQHFIILLQNCISNASFKCIPKHKYTSSSWQGSKRRSTFQLKLLTPLHISLYTRVSISWRWMLLSFGVIFYRDRYIFILRLLMHYCLSSLYTRGECVSLRVSIIMYNNIIIMSSL